MSTNVNTDPSTTVSRLTSAAPSAIAVLEINGPLALDFVKRCWRPNQGDSNLQINAIRYGFTQFDSLANGESIVVCRTAEHSVEIHCHGGRLASEAILRGLVAGGAVEQTVKLRFSAQDTDEIVSEAREDLLLASTLRTTAILLDQLRGSLTQELQWIRSLLIERDIFQATKRLTQLSSRSQLGSHLVEPWRVVLAGPPNSGKSSLLNMLLGYTRAIVHEQAGTTRDVLAEHSSFDGWPIELVDGAGIRTATDAIEATGIEQTLERIASADCTLLLVDRTTGWTETHHKILNHCSKKVVLVVTKSDLIGVNSIELLERTSNIPSSISKRVETSSVSGAGLKELMNAVVAFLVPQSLSQGDPVPFRSRHRHILAAALDCIQKNEIDAAIACLQTQAIRE